MSQAYPLDIARAINRKAKRRSKREQTALAQNDNHTGGGRCPGCNRPTPTAPIASEYLGKGVIHHHWRCAACGHDWMTETRVSV
jgi:hypothetical protein